MGEKEGLIRARYAVSVLRVARGSPAKDALKLVEGLSGDRLNMDSEGNLTESRLRFLNACEQLADALRSGSQGRLAWDRATNAAAAWLTSLEIK
jgi:hypothetical protein